MLTKDFDYVLPEELIAQQPTAQRTQSRLLVVPQKESFIDMHIWSFSEALQLIARNRAKSGKVPLIILNESKVYPARVLISKKSGAQGEVFVLNDAVLNSSLEKEKDAHESAAHQSCELATVLLRPLKKMRVGEVLFDPSGRVPLFEIEQLGIENARVKLLKPLKEIFSQFAVMPTPPYIKRQSACRDSNEVTRLDFERYQNVYASTLGSAAAPTAGLHFSKEFLDEFEKQRHAEFVKVTLHVGIGTFRPVQAESPVGHEMHSEYYTVSKDALLQIERAFFDRRPVVYLGTTSFRAVESFFLRASEELKSARRSSDLNSESSIRSLFRAADLFADRLLETSLFVYPKSSDDALYQPFLGDALFTNFHQPQSTLLMLVSALSGYQLTKFAYNHAIQQRYRFLSYGDASLFEFAQKSLLDH